MERLMTMELEKRLAKECIEMERRIVEARKVERMETERRVVEARNEEHIEME